MEGFIKKHILKFKVPSGTSRGILNEKETYFLILKEGNNWGIGECSFLKGLSYDDRDNYEDMLQWTCENIAIGKDALLNHLKEWPSIVFGLEQAFLSFQSKNPFQLFVNKFSNGEAKIPINGLVWMGQPDDMLLQIKQKIEAGFNCIKLKIAALPFEQELDILKYIRKNYDYKSLEIRVDANGGFNYSEALDKLIKLSDFKIHSIEQPIATKQYDNMAYLIKHSPIAIALDEELIGVVNHEDRENLLTILMPHYAILKPSLLGGFASCENWIALANKYNIGWWITSALESNIGLNAIAQWTYELENPMPQGLGTGSLYTNNIESPLEVKNGFILLHPEKKFNVEQIDFL